MTSTTAHQEFQPAGRRLVDHLKRLRGRVLARVIGRGALATAAWLSLAAAMAILLQGVFGPRLWLGLVLGGLFLVLAGWVIGTRLIDPLRRYPSLRRFAWVVDSEVLGGGDRIVGAFDLVKQREDERDPLTRALMDHAVAERLPDVENIGPRVLDRGPRAMPLVGMLVAAAIILGAFQLIAPLRMKAAWLALLHPTTFPYTPEVAIDVRPGDLTIDTGADVRVTVEVTGDTDVARLLYRKAGGPWKSMGMAQIESGEVSWMGHLDGSQVTVEQKIPRRTYRASLPDLRVDTTYRVRAGRDESGAYDIAVTTPPRVTEYSIATDPPSYAGIPDEALRAPVGNVAALRGSRATVTPVVDGEAERIEVVVGDGEGQELLPDANGRRAFAFDVEERFAYRVRVSDVDGRVRFESPSFAVDPLPDRDPIVQVTRPGDDTDVPDGLRLPVAVSCADDFGVTHLLMHVHKEPHDPFQKEIQRFEERTREEVVSFDWDLSSLEILPGETVTYWFELFDNDAITGPKSARSAIYEVRFPSMAEMYAEAEEEYAENVVDAVENIFEKEKELSERLSSLRQDVERSREGITWERQKEVESVLEGAESHQEQLSKALESMQRSMDRMGESNMTSFEILERMEMIQSLLEDVQDERLKAMMDDVRKALEEMDQRKLEEALEAFEFSQEEVLRSLDRAVDHLEQILAEQKLEAAMDELAELLEEQSRINEQLEQAEEGASNDGENAEGENAEGENAESENAEGENAEGESPDRASSDESEGDAESGDAESADASEGDVAESQESESGGESSESDGSQESESDTASESSASESESPPGESSESNASEQASSESSPSESQGQEQAMSEEELEALAERQDELREQLEELSKSIDELREMAEESHAQMSQQLQQASPEKNASEAGESMESASDAMRQPSEEDALRYGLSAEEQLQSMMNGMMQASQSMQAERDAEAAREMMALGADLLHLSNKQEGVIVAPDGSTTRQMAAEEVRLFEATGRASEKLHEIGKKTLFVSQSMLRDLGAVLDDMNYATTHFEAGNRARGQRDAHDAMSGLNNAVMDLLRAQQQMQQAGGACSNPRPNAMSRIPALSGMQKQLNEQTRSLQQQMGRGRLSPSTGQEAVQQLAARQEAIRRGLQQIAEELSERRDVLGRLDQMGGELEEIVDEMKKGRLNDEIVRRQQRILNRLLAAEKSIRQQDQDDQRMAHSAEDEERASPSALDEESLGSPERMEREILQGRTDPFPPRYRQMIEAYFKALGGSEAASGTGARP